MRNAFEIFHISTQVIQFYLSIPKQEEFIQKILSCESYLEFKELVPTGKMNWKTLRVRLFQFFSAANQSYGKFVSILCTQTIQQILNEHLIFYEILLEFKLFTLLNQYLIVKQSMNKEDMKQLFSLIIWKSNFLHLIMRIFIGYLIVVKVNKNTNIGKVFIQISKLVGIAITQNQSVLYDKDQFQDDCKQFIQLWLKYIEGTSNQEQISQIQILINQLRQHFHECLLYQNVMVRLDQLVTISLNLQITNSVQDITALKIRRINPVNNYMPVVNKLQIQNIGQRMPSEQSLTASKRIKTNQSQRSLKVKKIEDDPIFQVQLENYHIGQMVRKGYFKIKQPISLSTQMRTFMRTQPSFHNTNNNNINQDNNINEIEMEPYQTVIQHEHDEHDSIVEQPPLLNFIDIEPKISVKQPSSHLSDKSLKTEKKHSSFNPYKLRNLISSRFQQILDIAQDSESSSPNNQQKQSIMKRQNSHIQKEQFEEINNFLNGGNNGVQIDGRRNSSRRSGVRVSTPEIANQLSNQLTSDQESLKQSFKQPDNDQQSYFLQPIAVNKRLQRKNVVALKYGNSFFIESTNVYIPKFGFRFIYYKCVCDWRVKLILSKKKIVQLIFYELTFKKITFTFDLVGVQFENINNWGQICQQFIKQLQNLIGTQLSYLNYNQELTKHQYNGQSFLATEFEYELKEDYIKSMGLMKDVFRLLFNTYIFEQKLITGSKLKLCKEKDLTLIAIREIINVLNFYKYSIKKSSVNTNDSKYILLLKGMGETIKQNIGLINKLFNLRLNLCDGKYLLHKQLVKLKDLSIKVEEQDNTFLLVKASLVISNQINQQKYGNQILYYHKNDYLAKPLLEIEFEIDGSTEYQSLRLKFESIEKILEKKYHYSAKHIIDMVLFQQNRFIPRFRDFISQKLMINEQKKLAIRLNIFSLQDAQKLEACGMKLGFLLDLKTKVKPFAITEIERYIHDDTQKKLEYEQTTQEIYKRQHLFDKHFNKIFSDENENQDIERRNKSSLIELVKRYQLNIFENKEENTQKVGPIQIYSDNPFTDQHLDDYEEVKSQFFVRNTLKKNQIIHFRIKRKGFTIKYNGGLETRFHEGKRYQKFKIPQSEEDEQNIQLSCQFIRNAPKILIEYTLYKKLSEKLLRTSFRNTTLHDGFDMMKQIQSRSTLSEIPTYNVLHFILLNNCNYLLRFFNLKQFVLVQKIKNYGKFQIIIRVFYRFQQTDILTENDYFIMRLDFQDIQKKIGMMKLIFNRYDIVEILRIPIFTIMTDTAIVQTVMDIFHKVHLGIFIMQSVPYFLYLPMITKNQHHDHSTSEKVSRIRRINNFPENSSFKKVDFCKGFLEHFIQNHRLVLTYIKKLYLITQNNYGQIVRISRTPHTNISSDQVQNQEFIVFQVYRHLLLDQWILKIYVPRTTRFMATVIKNEDFRAFDQTVSKALSENPIGKVLQNIRQNTDPIPFKDFDHFIQMNSKFKTATQLMRASTREKSTLIGRKMSNLNIKPISRDLNDFFCLTNQLSEINEIKKTENNKYAHLEKRIWMNFINDQINYEPFSKKNSAFLNIIFQEQEFPLQEQLFQKYIRIERIGESHIEFYLKYMQKPLEQLKGFALLKGKLNLMHNNRISGLIQEMKYNEEQVRQLKKTSIFFPFDAISYANTSNYNIELMYFSYNKFTEVREQINLRELLNLYIADGFFKYQTNYMNSKLNLSDVLNICYYIIYKIKNQNFLNLSQYHTIPNLNQFNPSKNSQKQAIQQYKCFIKPYFCVIQQYYEEIKITCQHRTTLIEINQMFQITEIEEQIGIRKIIQSISQIDEYQYIKQLMKASLFIISLIIAVTHSTQIYYNKDLKYDFTNAKQNNVTVNTNQSLYLNLWGNIPYKCDLKTNRLLEVIEETVEIKSEEQEETTEEQVKDDIIPIYKIKEDPTSEASMIIVDSNQQCSILSNQKNIFPNQLQLLVNKKPFEGLILQKFDINDNNFKILLRCSTSKEFVELPNTNPDYKFVLSHQSACPILVQNPMVQTYINYKIIISIFLWIIGLFLVIYGFQFTRISTIIMAFLIGVSFFTLVIGEAALDYDSSGASMWIVFIAGLVVGLIYMNLTYNKFLIGCFNFGFSLGTVLSMILNSLFFYKFETNPIYLPLTLSIVILGTVLGLIGCRFVNSMGILSTSIVGAYIIIKPITWFTGKYQNELLLTKQYMYGFTIVTDYLFYVYLSLIFLIALIGVVLQYKQLKKTMSMDELFTYQDMKYYEMGNVNLQEQNQQKQNKPQVQGFDQQQELDGNVQFMKSITPERLTHSSKASH